MPKSIAHGCGNMLLQHAKELLLHSDLRPGDKMLFYTTCGWRMWDRMALPLALQPRVHVTEHATLCNPGATG